jgi:adenosylcobyric acid synthase
MAHAANASCLLVGDIDRGGVFAALLGTIELLEPEDRARIRGFVINKFRGDVELLLPGVEMMERRLGIPCAGIVPFLPNLGLEEEDGVAMEDRRTAHRVWKDRESGSPERSLRIGVIALPHMANFTDFDALAQEPSVSLAFLGDPAQASLADVIVLPGSKQTLDDLLWIRDAGFAPVLETYPGIIIGICGGFQMLGLSIDDPAGVESADLPRCMQGMGLLPVRTIMRGEKTVRRTNGRTDLWGGSSFSGYEIHMGETTCEHSVEPNDFNRDSAIISAGRVLGTYIHGLFDDDGLRHRFLEYARQTCELTPLDARVFTTAQRGARIDRWANHLRHALDMTLIRNWANI